ncbi:MAG: NADPH-dependent F420 reductase [Solirubrobacteraceae bacterium]
MSGSEPVAIIGGTGNVGYGLALRWAAAGVPVIIGSRDAGRAREAAQRTGAQQGMANADAVREAAIVVVTVPFLSQAQTLAGLKDVLREGQLLVDCTVPLAVATGGRATRTLGVWQGSAAQQAAELLVPTGVRVVAALHTVGAPTLADLDAALAEDVLVCGDRKADKRAAAALIERIDGLRAVDGGRLEQARIAESITAMLIGMNIRYKTHAGIRITGLPGTLW